MLFNEEADRFLPHSILDLFLQNANQSWMTAQYLQQYDWSIRQD